MVHRGKLILLLFITIFLFQLVSAAVPPQLNVNTGYGLEVSYPNFDTVQQNSPFNLSVHVYNISTGLKVFDSSTLNCSLEIYNQTGDESVSHSLDLFDDEYAYYMTSGNFSNAGFYSYEIYCNADAEGGFAHGLFEVTPSGLALDTQKSILYIGILFILIFIFVVLVIGYFKLPSGNSRNEEGEIIGINMFKYLKSTLFVLAWGTLSIILYLFSALASSYLEQGIYNILFMLFRLSLILAVPMVLFYFFWIFINVFNDRKIKQEMDRGVLSMSR